MSEDRVENTIVLELFTTLGCHLCEQAEDIVEALKEEGYQIQLELVDIADNEKLVERYGVRIPVIKPKHATSEIGWPFSLAELRAFVESF